MKEAVEICKLRLFLKLVSQAQRVEQLEPLPDIDFNIRAGNTLVGFTTLAEIRGTGKGKLVLDPKTVERIVAAAQDAAEKFQIFHKYQTEVRLGTVAVDGGKPALLERLAQMRDELDRYLASEYDVDPDKPAALEAWRESHKPFHWFTEFYGSMNKGGFDVVIGNPPYVEYRQVRGTYTVLPTVYVSEPATNLYAFCMEQAGKLCRMSGRFGMIVPSSLLGLDEVLTLRSYLFRRYLANWFSTYSIRPSKLFDGVDQRLCIHLAGPSAAIATALRVCPISQFKRLSDNENRRRLVWVASD
jgi:hypothetical protein